MSKSKTKKKGRVMWGFIYVVVFLTAFLASVVMKMTADPFHGKYTVKWDESVGTVYADLSYGEGAANKFDLYVPADSTPSFSSSRDGANIIGSRFQLTISAEET